MSRSNHNSDSKRYYDWIFHAYQDRLAAEFLCNDNRLYTVAAFHCQQCIEKALKGYLLFKNRKQFDGHNLTWLCKQAALMDQNFTRWITKSALLNRYYIETRYPADIPMEIDKDTIDDVMQATTEMLDFICSVIKFDINSYHKRKKCK